MNGEATSSSEDAPWVSAMVGGKRSKADAIAATAAKQSLPKWLLSESLLQKKEVDPQQGL